MISFFRKFLLITNIELDKIKYAITMAISHTTNSTP